MSFQRKYMALCYGVAIIYLGLACCACNRSSNSSPPVKKDSVAAKTAKKEPEPVVAVGRVEGVVKLSPGKELPKYPEVAMVRSVLRAKSQGMPKECSPESEKDRQPVGITDDGNLVGVMVAGSEFKRTTKTRDPIIHDVVIEDCRLKPSLVVAVKGDQLRLRNKTDFPLLPQYGASAFMESLIKGQDRIIQLDKGEVNSIVCGYTAPCGRTEVVVLYHSIYAITDKEGKFEIKNYPAGQLTKLNAWHPLFKETNTTIKLEPGETQHIELVLTPMVQKPASSPTAPTAPSPNKKEKTRGKKKTTDKKR